MDHPDHPRRIRCGGIGFPRGILPHMVLSILEQRPMSGSELSEEIEHNTGWRPSPGSMYPLLAMLEERGLIQQADSYPPTLRKYSLTQSGLRETRRGRRGADIKSRYHSIQKIYWRFFQGMRKDLFDAHYRLSAAVEKINPLIRDNQEASARVRGILEETAKEIERVNKQLEKT